MTETKPAERSDGWMEVAIAIVLSAGGLMTSWASYQSALWDGEQAAHYSRANALRVTASRQQLEADARRSLEMALFNSWLQAKARGNRVLADFYRQRFPPELERAFGQWIALKPLRTPSAPQTPFAVPGYKAPGAGEAAQQEATADATFAQGQEDNRVSDLFTQGAVFLATAMFFGGIGQVFKMRVVRLLLLAIAVAMCAAGIWRIATLPVLRPG
jgi:hypothetical protein